MWSDLATYVGVLIELTNETRAIYVNWFILSGHQLFPGGSEGLSFYRDTKMQSSNPYGCCSLSGKVKEYL